MCLDYPSLRQDLLQKQTIQFLLPKTDCDSSAVSAQISVVVGILIGNREQKLANGTKKIKNAQLAQYAM